MEPCLPGARVRVETPTPPLQTRSAQTPHFADPGEADVRTLVEAFKRGGPAEVRKQQKEPGGLSRLCGLELGGHRAYRDIGLKVYEASRA